jgi:CBS domain containing-hemolysin-like protein
VTSKILLAFVAVMLAAAVVLATYALVEVRARKRISRS